MYFNIFWKCGNWPSCSRECLLYWLRWHLVIETSSLTVTTPKSGLQYYPVWMWRHIGTGHCSWSSTPTDYVTLHASRIITHNTAITGHFSQQQMSRLLSSMTWRFDDHSRTGPCACRNGIAFLCITSLLSTMTCLITWMAWCELWPRRRHRGRKTYSLLWSLHSNSCPNDILNWLLRPV